MNQGQPGERVKMFTNFLLYDETPDVRRNFSGLLSSWANDGRGIPTEAFAEEHRPSFGVWSAWNPKQP